LGAALSNSTVADDAIATPRLRQRRAGRRRAGRGESRGLNRFLSGMHSRGNLNNEELPMGVRLFAPVALCVAVLTLASCGGGDGDGLDSNGRPLVPGSGDGSSAPLTPDLASIQSHVFTPICSVCHAGGSAPQGLHLDAANAYANLVGVPSNEVPALLRVSPGDPANSYIIQKLEGHAAVGARMPFGGPYLDDATIAVISQWITNGAPQTAAAAADGRGAAQAAPVGGAARVQGGI
jgi:hypothetical protein